MKQCIKYSWLAVFALLLMSAVAHAGIIDQMDTSLTDAEKQSLADSISPVGKLIAILQYLAGAIIVLGLIAGGYTYYKGDPMSKQQTLNRVGAVIIGSILVFGAVSIAKLLNLGG